MSPSLTGEQKNLDQTTDVAGAAIVAKDLPTMGTEVISSPASPEDTQCGAPKRGEAEAGPFQPRNFGEYELLQEIARGGMGVVYKARHRTLNRVVALKMILSGKSASDTAVQRFYQEARAAAKLDHPNIVPIFDIGEQEGNHFFTMAFIEGKTLKSLVAEKGNLSIQETLSLMVPIVEAVDFAHQHGIIHRDLKPDNVMLDAQGRPRVTDFGLAKRMGEGDPNLTAAGQILGTPAYMAPEQALGGERKIGPEADIYALGGILHFLLTGLPPFTGATMTEILSKVITAPAGRPSQHNAAVPTDLDEICARCLEKDVGKRYAKAADLARDLKDQIGSLTTGAATVTKVERRRFEPAASPPQKAGAGRWIMAAGVAAVLLLAIGGAYYGYQATRPNNNVPLVPVAPSNPDVAQLLIKDDVKNDFGLKAVMVGSMRGDNGARKLFEKDTISFEVEVERDAYVAIWSIDPEGAITQLFPNANEDDHLFRAGTARTIPSPDLPEGKSYKIEATPSTDVEEIRVVASTQKWAPIAGKRVAGTPYSEFRTAAEREEWQSQRRGLVLKATPKGQERTPNVAEGYLKYQVFPKSK